MISEKRMMPHSVNSNSTNLDAGWIVTKPNADEKQILSIVAFGRKSSRVSSLLLGHDSRLRRESNLMMPLASGSLGASVSKSLHFTQTDETHSLTRF